MDATLFRIRREVDAATAGMNADDWLRAPQGRWSSAQILEHLARAFGTTAKMLEIAIDSRTHPEVRSPTIQERLATFLVVGIGYMPKGRKAPDVVRPVGMEGEAALSRLRDNLDRMDAALSRAERIWGKGPLALHPVLGPLTPTEWRKFHLVHALHHMPQVRARRQGKL